MRVPRRPVGVVDHDIETGETQCRRDGKDERREPAKTFDLMQAPQIKYKRWGNTEIDKIGERIEFGAEPRGAPQNPCQTSIQAIEYCSRNDGNHCGLILGIDSEPDRGKTDAKRQ